MPKSKKVIHVFYSWQSDSPKETNLNAIRNALKTAGKRIEAVTPGLKIVPDEATRDTSGSPNIALKILEKIEAADIFVADVTTITAVGAERPCPNPNVGFELGYAVAELGWDRVILLFNTEFGSFPSDLPFDFVQNRSKPYKLGVSGPKSELTALSNFLETAIDTVIKKNPKRPKELRGLSRERLEHVHDVENMELLMSALHLPTLDELIERLPHSINDRAIWFFENFKGVVLNSLFNVYDPVLNEAVDQLISGWLTALSHDNEYHDTAGGVLHVFTNPGDMPLRGDRQKNWDEIDTARREMRRGLDAILARLREGYLEVNIRKTNAKAWNDYVEFQNAIGRENNNLLKPRKRAKVNKKKS